MVRWPRPSGDSEPRSGDSKSGPPDHSLAVTIAAIALIAVVIAVDLFRVMGDGDGDSDGG
jgi:hypothetical protein